mgnify:CR=1 FL=1|jgi:drug/metabolite transporter (DMT)-like permease
MNNRRAILALVATSLIFGLNYTVAKSLMPHFVSPPQFMLFRLGGSLLVLWPVYLLGGFKQKIVKTDYLRLFLVSLTGITLNQILFFEGLSRTSPVDTSIIHACSPILVMVFAAILLKERFTIRKGVGILLGATGAIWLVILGTQETAQGTTIGNILILLNIASYSLYLVLVKPLMRSYSALTVIVYSFTIGLLLVMPYILIDETPWRVALFTPKAWIALLYVIYITTLLAFLLTNWALQHVTATLAGYFIYLQPVIATTVALLTGQDHFDYRKVVAACVIFTGIIVVNGNLNLRRRVTREVKADVE